MSEYEYPFLDEKTGKVICQLCGKSFLVISPRHLQTHSVTYSEYKLRFPDAPLSCEEFAASSKYGKEKELFDFDNETKVEEEPEIEEEIKVEKIVKLENVVKKKDLFAKSKDRILDHLKLYFNHMQKDYMIIEYSVPNVILFQCISDFADPILKVNIEFPNAFWHNQDAAIDLQRNAKLRRAGWKVIEIKSKGATFEDIEKAIKGYN